MNNLNHGTELDGALTGVIQQLAGEKQQCRSKALSAASPQIFADLGDSANAGDGIAAEFTFYGSEVIVQEIENFFRGAGDGRVQGSPINWNGNS
jgi:hypothetical protein